MEKRVFFRSRWLPWLLLAPQAGVIAVFFFWPAGQALLQSFQQSDALGMEPPLWVGWDNFAQLFQDPQYLRSFRTTAVFALLVAGLGLVLALLLAVMAERLVRASKLYRTLLILPYAVAPAVVGVLWLFLFSPQVGIVAYALKRWGWDWNPLLNSQHAMALIVMAAVWKQISYNFLFFLTGLQSIPRSLMEASAMDGAGPWQRFWTMQLPLLGPTALFLLVVNGVYAFFDTFPIVDATTKGGPGQDTLILIYKAYLDGFKNMDVGSAAAQSVVLMGVVVVLTVVQFRWMDKRVNYR